MYFYIADVQCLLLIGSDSSGVSAHEVLGLSNHIFITVHVINSSDVLLNKNY